MKYILSTFLFLSLLFLTSAGQAATDKEAIANPSGPVSLRENIIVSGAYIRLKDFFINAPVNKAETAVAYAPKPGRRASFDARWLFRVARAYGVQWRPLSSEVRSVVTRDSIVIDKTEIKDAIQAALTEYDLPENPEIVFSNKNLRIHVPTEIMPEVNVEDVTFNRRSKRFAVVVSVGEKNMDAHQRFRITGQVHKMIEVPTLARRISKGEIITQNDLTWIKMRADRTQRDVIVNADDIIGMTPKRHLRVEQPIRSADIQRPVLVEKGSLVTIILKKPGMTLTSQGRAMQNGADGETVRITNVKTSRTIEAIVIGSAMVTVIPTGTLTSQLAYNQ